MWQRRLVPFVVAAALLAGCGSSPSTSTVVKAHFTYGPTPSHSAKMICRAETIEDLENVLGVATVSHPTATWSNHQYTCPYRYSNGTMTLWVKELPTLPATAAYMVRLRHVLGFSQTLQNVGQGGFATADGSTVTKKDNKVLVVDVAKLPAMFGKPATSRADVALTVTDVIFACWHGD